MLDRQSGWFRMLGIWANAPRINRAAAVVIALALLVVLNPELRLLLLAIDAVGFDVFLVFIGLQMQAGIGHLYRNYVRWIARRIGRMFLDWGPVPFRMPVRGAFSQHPALMISSLASPLAAAGTVLSVLFFAAIWVGEALHPKL